MQFEQAIDKYQQLMPGFGIDSGVPAADLQAQAMDAVHALAQQVDPSEAFEQKRGYVHQWLDEVRKASPQLAAQFENDMLANPEAASLMKSMEFTLALTDRHSPETWSHVKRLGTLTARMTQAEIDAGNKDIKPMHALVGSVFHDVGKLAIHPDLLHKNGRIELSRFQQLVGTFDKAVPDYPQKEHDLKFLIKANEGRVVFAEADEMTTSPSGNEMVDVDALPQHDADMPDVTQRVTNSHVLARILAHAQHAGLSDWMSHDEIDAIASTKRGTLSDEERAIIETHDPMSEKFVNMQSLPAALQGLEQVVNMNDLNGASVEAQTIHHADAFEALTAERSYKPAYSVSDSLAIMKRMAEKGVLDTGRVDAFVKSDIWMDHAQQFGCELGDLSSINDMKPEGDTPKWSQSVKAGPHTIQVNIQMG
ncbi:MAG: hypothetical protein MRY32_06965 [Rickettsiales bacterium]|nr:hypothetical protein [Rickettsiales bacterium]